MLKKRHFYLICLFLVVATFAVYWQVLDNDFVIYDDDVYVTENTHVHKGVTFDSLTWAFTSSTAANWHPLTWVSHMIDFQLYGLNAKGHHLTSLLFHVAAVDSCTNDRYAVAKRFCCSVVRPPSSSCGVCCLGGRTERCPQHIFHDADCMCLHTLC